MLRPPRSRIGRSRDNDIVLADHDGAGASGHHAEAVRHHKQWWIHDLQSTNGTRLNGAPITRAAFAARDRLQFGDVECEVLPGRFLPALAGVGALALVVGLALAFVVRGSPSPSFSGVAAEMARSVYLVAIDTGGERRVVGTAFVVDRTLLATNAHVAEALSAAPGQPAPGAVVIRSDATQPQPITGVHIAAGWQKGSIADDVALLRVPALGADARMVRLADAATLASLTRGLALATFGFPAISTDPQRPRGRLVVDVLGDVRDGRYLAVGLRIAPGTSGSPIFLRDGTVVGLVAGGDFTVSPGGDRSPSGTNVNWGISIAPLGQLLRDCAAQ